MTNDGPTQCPGCEEPLADHDPTSVRGPDTPLVLQPCGTAVAPELLADAPTGNTPVGDGALLLDRDQDDAWLHSTLAVDLEGSA